MSTWYSSAAFLRDTQPEAADSLALSEDGPTRRAFLTRLQGEIAKRGTIDVLRNGIRAPVRCTWSCSTARPRSTTRKAQERFEQNRFTVTRQLRYSRDEVQRALDIGLFINGLPVFTFELKNSLTKQTADDAVLQYQQDRNPREKAVRVRALHRALRGGRARGAVLHPSQRQGGRGSCRSTAAGTTARATRQTRDGLAIDYLWREVLPRESVTNILENYAQVVEDQGRQHRPEETGTQVWPRYHQLDVVRRLLADAEAPTGRAGAT